MGIILNQVTPTTGASASCSRASSPTSVQRPRTRVNSGAPSPSRRGTRSSASAGVSASSHASHSAFVTGWRGTRKPSHVERSRGRPFRA